MSKQVTKKKDMNFQNAESLKDVQSVINEAALALNDKTRTIKSSAISEVLAGAAGMGVGGAMSFAALFFAGKVVGLSAAGITSGLAAAGGIIGGGMAAGVGIIAAPVAILGAAAVGAAAHHKNKQLRKQKELCYQEAIKKQNAIIVALREEKTSDKERIEYLNSLNILLQSAIKDLKHDLGV